MTPGKIDSAVPAAGGMAETAVMEKVFRQMWYDGGTPGQEVLRLLLTPFSRLYGLAVAFRNRRFDLGLVAPVRLPAPVISVGNVSVGGTGKTPMVIGLARMLQARGYRPAVLSRGYGGASRKPVNIVSTGTRVLMTSREAGDEPVLIAKSLAGVPVLTGPRRILTGPAALNELGADVLILDDGFQHRQLFRDIDIVLLHAAHPLGNGCLLPAGPLREPISALRRADIIIATGSLEEAEAAAERPIPLPDGLRAPLFRCYYRPSKLLKGPMEEERPLDFVKGKKILAFAGIGNPAAFKQTLASLGGDVAGFLAFPDHHCYREANLGMISEKARQCGAEMIVTTEKDKIKLADCEAFLSNVHTLRIELEFSSGSDAFERLILKKLEKSHAG